MANAEKCQEVLDQILMHPESHEQATWIDTDNMRSRDSFDLCGTTMCVAGWAAYLDGRITWDHKFYTTNVDARVPMSYVRKDPNLAAWVSIMFLGSVATPEDEFVDAPWGVLGAYLLDLGHEEAARLFDADNETAVRCLKALANGESILDKNAQIRADLDANLT